MLWKNERKIVVFAKCLAHGKSKVVTVDCAQPDEANDFELVHMTGNTVNGEEIMDPDFGVSVQNAYRLTRKVEMYQW